LIVLLCALPIGAVVLIGGAVAFFGMRSANVQRAEAQATLTVTRQATDRVWTRDEFNALIGSTPKDVEAALGPPQVSIMERNRPAWYYRNKTKDPATGKIDPQTKVIFEGGVVVEVNF
jgi:hypothetical protein